MRLRSAASWRSWILPFLIATAAAQATPSPVAPAAGAPAPYASVSELNMMLSQLERVAQTMQVNLAKLRIEKWKTDANTKRDSLADVDSIQRNLQMALPEILGQLRAAPESLPATFKLYRNLDALYDVLGPVVESAGAFGSRDEFQSVQNDFSALERSRRSLADRLENLASAKEGELSQLHAQVRELQVAAPATPAKKVVVDDTTPPPKPPKKKPVAKPPKPPAPATAAQKPSPGSPPAQPPQTQP